MGYAIAGAVFLLSIALMIAINGDLSRIVSAGAKQPAPPPPAFAPEPPDPAIEQAEMTARISAAVKATIGTVNRFEFNGPLWAITRIDKGFCVVKIPPETFARAFAWRLHN